MDKRRIDELGILYVERLALYEEYASRIRNLIQDLIEQEGVEFQTIEGRAKPPGGLIQDLSSIEGEEDLADIDLVTVRVLLRFPEDVYKIEAVVRSEFDVDESRSVPSSGLEDPFRFGYPAVSYALALSETRAGLREWAKYQGLSFRLELRTMLQDAWAAIAPRVNQSVGTLPEKKLQRKLIRLAALLEEADEGFLALREEARNESLLVPPSASLPSAGARRGGTVAAERTFTEEELYRFFMDGEPGLLSHWNSVSIEAGFPVFMPDAGYLRESCAYLCKIFRAAGIDTFSDVRAFLSEVDRDGRGLRQLQSVRTNFGENLDWHVDPFSALFLLALNLKWDRLKDKDLVALGIKKGSDRIVGS